MTRYFGYVRVSTNKQGEGVSLEAQKDEISRFAERNNIEIIQWFEEEQTAAKSGRPVFNQLIKLLQKQKADGLVMHKIDRSARNFFDWHKIGMLADSGIDIHFAAESLDFHSRGGRLTANIQMAIAEDYVRNLKAEIHKGQRAQLERGYYPFRAPMGYIDNGPMKFKTIDPNLGPKVRLAFELYATGQYSLRTLPIKLTEYGFTKSSGKPLSRSCIEKLLMNSFYAGVVRIKSTGETFEGGHDALITPTLFDRVRQVRAGKCNKRVTQHQHLFRGLFKCGTCNRSMIAEKQKGYVYYRCHLPECPTNSIREEPIVARIAEILNSHSLDDFVIHEIDEIAKQYFMSKASGQADLIVRKKLADLECRIKNLEDAAISKIISPDQFHERKADLLLEQSSLKRKIEKAVLFHEKPVIIRGFLERLKNVAELYEKSEPDEKREIVEIVTSNRVVSSRNVLVEPSNWLKRTADTVGVLYGGEHHTTSRTSNDDVSSGRKTLEPQKTRKQQLNTGYNSDQEKDVSEGGEHRTTSRTGNEIGEYLDALSEISQSPEVERLLALFVQDYEDAGGWKTNTATDNEAVISCVGINPRPFRKQWMWIELVIHVTIN